MKHACAALDPASVVLHWYISSGAILFVLAGAADKMPDTKNA